LALALISEQHFFQQVLHIELNVAVSTHKVKLRLA